MKIGSFGAKRARGRGNVEIAELRRRIRARGFDAQPFAEPPLLDDIGNRPCAVAAVDAKSISVRHGRPFIFCRKFGASPSLN